MLSAKVVVAPEPWFCTRRYDTSDLLPRGWLTAAAGFRDEAA